MIALIFSLTGLTVFGVGYNLARSRAFEWGTNRLAGFHARPPAIIAGILAMVFVLVMGNFQVTRIAQDAIGFRKTRQHKAIPTGQDFLISARFDAAFADVKEFLFGDFYEVTDFVNIALKESG